VDAISALAVCLLLVPVAMLAGWLVVEHHDRFTWTWHRRERRGFEVIMRGRAGYSFTEVMFAVVVLGVGFIMIAAMFPVAMSQQQSTQQETNAASLARSAMAYFEATATNGMLPVTGLDLPVGEESTDRNGHVFSIRNPQASTPVRTLTTAAPPTPWDVMKGTLINTGNSRYGMAMFYKRAGEPAEPNTWKSYAQVIVVIAQVRNRSTYKPGEDIAQSPEPTLYNLQGRPVAVTITDDGIGPNVNQVARFSGANAGSVAEGSYVIIADDNLAAPNEGAMNGHVFRVGTKLPGVDEWELSPGNEFKPFDLDGTGGAPIIEGLTNAGAFIIGRNTTATAGTYDGPAQDIAVYTSFVQVK
jgi:Tfp pilus assembly protein PilV